MHIINHNILHKIIDIMARNNWKYKFANINKQYLSYFTLNDDITISIYNFICICGKNLSYFEYNWRDMVPKSRRFFKIFKNNICSFCTKFQYYLPKKYFYTSGLNHPFAYKKI